MTKKVNLICPSCAKHNGGEWRNEHATASIMLGRCQVCEEITPITHIHYWKNIHGDMALTAPKASEEVESAKVEKPAKVSAPKTAKGGKVSAESPENAVIVNSILD